MVWKEFGDVEVFSSGTKYMIKFQSVQDCDKVLDHGFWHIWVMLLVLQKWRLGSKIVKEKMSVIPV